MNASSDHLHILPVGIVAARVTNPTSASNVVLVCEHASAYIPPSLNHLGLNDDARSSHVAWDIGALEVAREMSRELNAPLVEATVSRLVYDCNRPPDAPGAMPTQSEKFIIPGNAELNENDRKSRVAEIYQPFSDTLSQTITNQNVPPVLITIHSFTPVFHGKKRTTEIGFLHDEDAAFAHKMLGCAAQHTTLKTTLNEPYSRADGVTHTLARFGTRNGLQNVMIEVRNDLICDVADARRVGRELAKITQDSLSEKPSATPPHEKTLNKHENHRKTQNGSGRIEIKRLMSSWGKTGILLGL